MRRRPEPLPRTWRLMGLFLPRSIRGTVFEPACLDLVRDRGTVGWLRTTIRFLGTWLASLTYSIPRYFSEDGATPTAARILLIVLMLATTAVAITLVPWVIALAQTAATGS